MEQMAKSFTSTFLALLIAGILTGVLAWVATSFDATRIELARMPGRLDNMSMKIEMTSTKIDNLASSMSDKLNDLDWRLKKVEATIRNP